MSFEFDKPKQKTKPKRPNYKEKTPVPPKEPEKKKQE